MTEQGAGKSLEFCKEREATHTGSIRATSDDAERRKSEPEPCSLNQGTALGLGLALSSTPNAVQAQQPAVSVAGGYRSQWGGGLASISLQQQGQHVVGVFINSPPVAPGALAGVLQGNVLTGRWTDARSTGGFSLTFSPDGRSFTGTWGRTVASNTDGGPWTGTRQ